MTPRQARRARKKGRGRGNTPAAPFARHFRDRLTAKTGDTGRDGRRLDKAATAEARARHAEGVKVLDEIFGVR